MQQNTSARETDTENLNWNVILKHPELIHVAFNVLLILILLTKEKVGIHISSILLSY